jgi:hypothetical protein
MPNTLFIADADPHRDGLIVRPGDLGWCQAEQGECNQKSVLHS